MAEASSETLWRLSMDMLAIAGLDGCFRRVNPAWEQTLGYSSEELTSQPYLNFVHPDDVDRTLSEAAALLQPGHQTVDFVNRYRSKNGEYRWLAWKACTDADLTQIFCVVRDVTADREAAEEREALLAKSREREMMLKGVIENNMTLIYVKDLDGRYLLYNQPFADAFQLDRRGAEEGKPGLEVLLGRDDTWLDPELQAVWRENDLRAARGSHAIEEWSDHPELGRLTYDSIKFPLHNAANEVYATCGVSMETTLRTRAIAQYKAAEERFHGAFDHAPIGMALVAPSHEILQANGALAAITGYTAEELRGKTLQEMTHPEDVDAEVEALTFLAAGLIDSHQTELRLFNSNGHTIWVLSSWSAVRDEEGHPQYFIAQLKDISERKLLQEQLQRVADHDSLTGLRNRRMFEEDLQMQFGRCQRYGEQAALLMIDLDDFKKINDLHGHKAGDDALKAVATALKKRLRSIDGIARLGGDEFAALLAHVGRGQAEEVAEDLRDTLASIVITVNGQSVSVTGSVGLAFMDEHTESADAALVEADRAMYHAKRAAREATAALPG